MSKKTAKKEQTKLQDQDITTATKSETETVLKDEVISESNENTEAQSISKEAELELALAEEKNKFLRLFAEFENYKKRTSKERIELFKTASQDVMVALLPILDDFERALTHMEHVDENDELKKGVLLIYNKFSKTLEQKGLIKVEVNKGEPFNADQHEAVTQIPAPTDDLKGKIIDVLEHGYKLGDKTIRFPKVVIGQ